MKRFFEIVCFLLALLLCEVAGSQVKSLIMNGLVFDKRTSLPLQGARVTLVGNKAKSDVTTSDKDGVFVLPLSQGVEPGSTVRIRVEMTGYKPYDKFVPVSSEIPLQVLLEPKPKSKPPNYQPKSQPTVVKPSYYSAHLAVVGVRLWAAPMKSEAMVTVRNIGSKPIVPCAILRGAIITSPWLSGSEAENQLFVQRPEWQEGGKKQVNCDTDWNPGVEKTYSIKLGAPGDGPDEWTSLMLGEKVWYVVSRLQYQDSDMGSALPPIENCVYFRAEKPEWDMDKCFGHNDPTLHGKWTSGSGGEGSVPEESERPPAGPLPASPRA